MIYKIKIAMIRFIQRCLFFIPLKNNRIMFYASNRKGIVCNPAALMDYLWRNMPEQYELIWVSRFPDTCDGRTGITIVRQRSLAYFRLFLRTKFFITNDMIDETLIKKKGQVFLTTWHGGGAYKKVGISTTTEDREFKKNFKKWYGRLDYFVSSCQVCTDMYGEAFGLKPSCFLETGTPRNDIFFSKHSEINSRVRDFYKIPDQAKILLFAPSFQMTAPEKEQYDRQQLAQIALDLEKSTKSPWYILYRTHYLREKGEQEDPDVIKDGNAYYEMQDLLYAADVLVTDFSSCIWDFSLTGRMIVVMENRLKEYEAEDRGFFVPYETWPYIKIQQLSDLIKVIPAHYKKDFSSVYKKHWKEMGSFETGTACETIIDLLQHNGGIEAKHE